MTKPLCYPATLEKLGSKDAYLIDNGEYIYVYLGNQVSDTFIYNVRSKKRAYLIQVFGYANFSDMKFSGITTFAPIEGSDLSAVLSQLIEQLRSEKSGGSYAPLRLVYAGDSSEKEMFDNCLVEDTINQSNEFPYSEFLCTLHKLIRNKNTQ